RHVAASLTPRRPATHDGDAAATVDRVEGRLPRDDRGHEQAVAEPADAVVGDRRQEAPRWKVGEPACLPGRANHRHARMVDRVERINVVAPEGTAGPWQTSSASKRDVSLAASRDIAAGSSRVRRECPGPPEEGEAAPGGHDHASVGTRTGDVEAPGNSNELLPADLDPLAGARRPGQRSERGADN